MAYYSQQLHDFNEVKIRKTTQNTREGVEKVEVLAGDHDITLFGTKDQESTKEKTINLNLQGAKVWIVAVAKEEIYELYDNHEAAKQARKEILDRYGGEEGLNPHEIQTYERMVHNK